MDDIPANRFSIDFIHSTLTTFLERLPINLTLVSLNKPTVTAFTAACALVIALRLYRRARRIPRLTGPPSKGFLLGVNEDTPDLGDLYADWERKYGAVYELPSTFGSRHLVLGDPKGSAHFFANDTTVYRQPEFTRILTQHLHGDALSVVEGETHKRQRRAMSPAFSTSAIRNILPVFVDCAGKLTSAWNTLLESENPNPSQGGSAGSITMDITKWMNNVSFDSLGKSAFAHDFGLLTGSRSPISETFDAVASLEPTFFVMTFFLLGPIFPWLFLTIPNPRVKAMRAVTDSIKEIGVKFMENKSGEASDGKEKSILRALIKSETASSKVHMSVKEIEAQIPLFISAGYQTTAITLTWALIELARNPEIQRTLRAELEERIPAGEVTFDKLMNGLPYLDAFTCELLRLHPVQMNVIREANEDDVIPLSRPIVTASGTVLDSINVAKGTTIEIPIIGINRSEALWGPDAAMFDPTRWLEEKPGEYKERREEVQGYRHLLSFASGPRACLGRVFGVTKIKAVLSVLVRSFTFEFPGGPDTPISGHRITPLRPKVVGEEGTKVPLVIQKVLNN